jgi:serine/threonine protein kinase, bacterial
MTNTFELINNRYRILRELGKGGFGATFLVEDTQLPSGKRFVLKELMPIEHDAQTYTLVKQRFEREAVILEELGGLTTQIPSLYAYFTEAGKFYLVQEYVEGQTIAETVTSQGVMSDAAVRDWLSGLLAVLSVVHDRQIIHRDIKPDNIILQQRDQKPVLIDFGAVRETMGMKLTPQGRSTQSIVIGTPGYMSSEQAAGRAVFASDLYSLGLTAVFALTGKIPQELPTDPMTGDIQWQSYAPTVSNGLAGILTRAIASHSQNRFTTAPEMMAALGAGFVSGSTIPVPTQVSGSAPVTQPPVYARTDSQMRTVVAAHPHAEFPSQTGGGNYVNPINVPQASASEAKTWLMAIGTGALVALTGVGFFVLSRGNLPATTVVTPPATAVVSPTATPVVAPSVVAIAPASVAPSPSVTPQPSSNAAPSTNFNAEIIDPPSNCRSNPGSTYPIQKVLSF